ncbi:MAG: theronine dehydrogenase, partial [Pseudonocardiaceae bacterium]
HGFARERFRTSPGMLVRVPESLEDLGVLVEPATVGAKAWEHIEWIAQRSRSSLHRVLVTGSGPIGLLVTLMAVQRGYEVHVLGRATSGLKPDLVAALGAQYHTGGATDLGCNVDVAVECTGACSVIEEVLGVVARNGIVCLTGLSAPAPAGVDLGTLGRDMVLKNLVVFGSVNANRRHFEAAGAALTAADSCWLAQLVTTRVPAYGSLPEAGSAATVLERGAHDVKTVLQF